MLDDLAAGGVEAIAFKGPVLAIRAYGDLGFRIFRDLDFLVRDDDLALTIGKLRRLGYARKGQLTEAQFELIHRLQGQEIMFHEATGMAIEPHTRLTSLKFAIDIDYSALWRRAQRVELNGRRLLLLAPEDDLIALAVHGGKEVWWNVKWVCDIAAFIAANPSLDWRALLARARDQGCLRMVLLATGLARRYFGADVPEMVIAAERAVPRIESLIGRACRQWQAARVMGPPTLMSVSPDRLLLHDGLLRRARYVAKTVFLPGPHHVETLALPRSLRSAYVPFRFVHDLAALPLVRLYRRAIRQLERWQEALASSGLALAFLPALTESGIAIRHHGRVRLQAKRRSRPTRTTRRHGPGSVTRLRVSNDTRRPLPATTRCFNWRRTTPWSGSNGQPRWQPPADPVMRRNRRRRCRKTRSVGGSGRSSLQHQSLCGSHRGKRSRAGTRSGEHRGRPRWHPCAPIRLRLEPARRGHAADFRRAEHP